MQTQLIRTPFTTLGSIFAIIAIIAWLIGFFKVYKSYKETGKKQSLFFAVGLLFGGSGVFFLALEQILLQIFDAGSLPSTKYVGGELAGILVYDVAYVFAILAAASSAVTIVMFNAFSLSFFENKLKFILPTAILIIVYMIIFVISEPVWQLNASLTDYDFVRTPYWEGLILASFIYPLFFPAIVFIVMTIQVRGNTYNFRRALALSFIQTFLSIAYVAEILGTEGIFVVVARFIIMSYPVAMWITLNPGDRYKKILGASS